MYDTTLVSRIGTVLFANRHVNYDSYIFLGLKMVLKMYSNSEMAEMHFMYVSLDNSFEIRHLDDQMYLNC